MDLENIKAKVSFYYKGTYKPFASTENYDSLKKILYIKGDSDDETEIKTVVIEDVHHEIEEIKISVLRETATSHLE